MGINPELQLISLLVLAGLLAFLGFLAFPKLSQFLLERFASPQTLLAYQQIVEPSLFLIQIVFGLAIADIILLLLKPIIKLYLLEINLSLTVAIIIVYLGYQLINRTFSIYIEDSLNKARKLDDEFFLGGKILANLVILFIVTTIFCKTHNIDIFALITSIGISGVVIAFASQKILEQLIGGVVLFFDSPFTIDDYIKLPDGTFGRVESIGLRLTKIRTSGKGTLVSVPNNSLTQVNVENFTNAGKTMAIVDVVFERVISLEEQTIIRQVIIASTKDIWGIDSRSTSVNFSHSVSQNKMRAQVSLFMLNSGKEISMELRLQLLGIARKKISQKLNEYGITYEAEERTASINLPMSM